LILLEIILSEIRNFGKYRALRDTSPSTAAAAVKGVGESAATAAPTFARQICLPKR